MLHQQLRLKTNVKQCYHSNKGWLNSDKLILLFLPFKQQTTEQISRTDCKTLRNSTVSPAFPSGSLTQAKESLSIWKPVWQQNPETKTSLTNVKSCVIGWRGEKGRKGLLGWVSFLPSVYSGKAQLFLISLTLCQKTDIIVLKWHFSCLEMRKVVKSRKKLPFNRHVWRKTALELPRRRLPKLQAAPGQSPGRGLGAAGAMSLNSE